MQLNWAVEYRGYFERGKALYLQGKYDQAVEDFTTVIELQPDWASGYFWRGVTLSSQGNYDQAVEDLSLIHI